MIVVIKDSESDIEDQIVKQESKVSMSRGRVPARRRHLPFFSSVCLAYCFYPTSKAKLGTSAFVGKPPPWIGRSQGHEGEPPRKWARIGGDVPTPTIVQHHLIVSELVEACEQVLRYSRWVKALKEELASLPAEGL